MLVIGAKGHAIEILDIIEKNLELFFFDDITTPKQDLLYNEFKILHNFDEVIEIFKKNNQFAIGIGNSKLRYQLFKKFASLGGEAISIIAPDASIGKYDVILGKGLNIMRKVVITNDVLIGDGTLINASVLIHHNCRIGKFCEISPGSIITGNCKIGDFTTIGAGTVLVPNIEIGNNCIIAAGSVVTKNIPDNCMAAGTPARVVKSTI